MVSPWRSLCKAEQVRIIAPDGTIKCTIQAYFSGSMFVVEDLSADMEAGDELRRILPNGKDDVFRIDDPRFFDAGGFPAHYQVKVSRKGSFAHNTGGHFITISGQNSRVNIGSTDNSTNIANEGDVFGQMRQAVEAGVTQEARRSEILDAIDEAERTKGTPGFLKAYQRIIGVAADHIGVLGPFLPALANLLPS